MNRNPNVLFLVCCALLCGCGGGGPAANNNTTRTPPARPPVGMNPVEFTFCCDPTAAFPQTIGVVTVTLTGPVHSAVDMLDIALAGVSPGLRVEVEATGNELGTVVTGSYRRNVPLVLPIRLRVLADRCLVPRTALRLRAETHENQTSGGRWQGPTFTNIDVVCPPPADRAWDPARLASTTEPDVSGIGNPMIAENSDVYFVVRPTGSTDATRIETVNLAGGRSLFHDAPSLATELGVDVGSEGVTQPSVNGAGLAAFAATASSRRRLIRGDTSSAVVLFEDCDLDAASDYTLRNTSARTTSDVVLNNLGTVVFRTTVGCIAPNDSALVLGDGTQIAGTGGAGSFFFLGAPTLAADSDLIAFHGDDEILTASAPNWIPTARVTLATAPALEAFLGPVDLAPNGRLVFLGNPSAAGLGSAVYMLAPGGTVPTLIADDGAGSGSLAFDEIFEAAVNSSGEVAFLAQEQGGSIRGLFLYDPVTAHISPIVREQEMLGAEVISRILWDPTGFNDAARAAVTLVFASGAREIVRYDPR